MKYIAPARGLNAFTCPHCGVYSRQNHKSSPPQLDGNYGYFPQHAISTSICEHCNKFSLWCHDKMVFPNRGAAPHPNPDIPVDIKADYEEAAAISLISPRGAAALLRLAIQKLCVHLGGEGKNINEDIGSLVKKGLPEKVQQALDIVRVVGNNAVHPGQIETDSIEVVSNLFVLINVITETMVSMPNKINTLYSGLPDGALEGIKKRDNNC